MRKTPNATSDHQKFETTLEKIVEGGNPASEVVNINAGRLLNLVGNVNNRLLPYGSVEVDHLMAHLKLHQLKQFSNNSKFQQFKSLFANLWRARSQLYRSQVFRMIFN